MRQLLVLTFAACAPPAEPPAGTDTGPAPAWVTIDAWIGLPGAACAHPIAAELPGAPWALWARGGCDTSFGEAVDSRGNAWFFTLGCTEFPIDRDPLFGPGARVWHSNGPDAVCPEDPTFSWTYPADLAPR